MVNWRHLVRVGARALCQILEGVPAALAAAWQLQLRKLRPLCQILMAATKTANFEACQVLKELRQLQNFTMRSSCVWRGELPHSICSIWANENYEQDTDRKSVV